MSGPLTGAVFLLLSIAFLLPSRPLEAKSLSGSRGTGAVLRLRRELRDSLPYEAQMMSYPPAAMEGRGNELFYQPEGRRGQGLGQALQRLVEDDRRRDQEAAYLTGLLRLLSEADGSTQRAAKGEEEEEEEEEGPGDFQGPYPPDYDETDQGISMAKPQAVWQGLLDPQLTQALLNRYRQERLLQAGLNSNRLQESGGDPAAEEREEEVLRYLVGRILSSLASDTPQSSPGRLAKRDLGAVSGGMGGGRKRSRRSADSAPLPSQNYEPSLLRVKRLGDEEEKMADGPAAAGVRGEAHVGLQRMKRIDSDLQQQKHKRRRRALTYDPNLLAQRILQYLPQ
ncbi:proprotein convertase subtilisin/kexin type 1 inhibitor, like [Megalops cyprinoides]|uniref:proprotein convertase subtilisin/kexin type 1 inhibitor, like n=1 Tax=Megalops cyprinoides TaxID=118141 RepID=UPI00186492F7|nr:proprotein convertase subtilisin/kexin type 1 inhibitor, like [Megalops cyprinoides]